MGCPLTIVALQTYVPAISQKQLPAIMAVQTRALVSQGIVDGRRESPNTPGASSHGETEEVERAAHPQICGKNSGLGASGREGGGGKRYLCRAPGPFGAVREEGTSRAWTGPPGLMT